MVLDMFRYEGVEVVVSYFPVWEMFFSMHVLSNPEHHLTRRKSVRYTYGTVLRSEDSFELFPAMGENNFLIFSVDILY